MNELQTNLLVMGVCYLYILAIILAAGYLRRGILDPKSSRKFLHIMIGNLPLIMPYFTESVYPFLVACSFIPVTFLVTPYSPFRWLGERLSGLRDLTEEGHHIGLVLYAISYSLLAYFFGTAPFVVAAGIFPMAYGDSAAAIIGTRYGRHKLGSKSLEGSAGMFLGSLISLLLGMTYFSFFYPIALTAQLGPVLLVSIVVTVAEFLSPSGFDNVAVPLLGALTYLFMGGGG